MVNARVSEIHAQVITSVMVSVSLHLFIHIYTTLQGKLLITIAIYMYNSLNTHLHQQKIILHGYNLLRQKTIIVFINNIIGYHIVCAGS